MHLESLMKLLEKNRIAIGLRTGNHVRIRRSWRAPLAGRSGVISAIEPNDPYGTYLIQFDDGLQFRYERQDLELMVGSCAFPEPSFHPIGDCVELPVCSGAQTHGVFIPTGNMTTSRISHTATQLLKWQGVDHRRWRGALLLRRRE